jgi:Fic family protein
MATVESKKGKEPRIPAVIPELPPKGIDRLVFIKELIAAHAAIGELRGYLGTLQNPDLLIAPFRKREAVASSAIEGTRATLDEVMEYEAADGEREAESEESIKERDIREIRNYEAAMSVAMNELRYRPIGETLLSKTHARLLRSVRGSTKTPGEFRKGPVAVGDFLPPAHPQIPRLMSNWERYLNSAIEADTLIRIAVAHYQFEAIHPFLDGNGRIGRLIIPLFLCQKEVLSTPVLYISDYLEKYKVEYQRRLHEVDTHQRWNEWIKFFLIAVEAQTRVTIAKAKEIQGLYERLKKDVVGSVKSRHGMAVLDLLFRQPVISAFHVRSAIKAKSTATAYNLINSFVEAGVLKPLFTYGKEKYYEFKELRDLIRS